MSPEIHKMWSGAHFALRPLGYNDQKTELALEWHWLPKKGHKLDDEVNIGKVPNPTMVVEMDPEAARLQKGPSLLVFQESSNPTTLIVQ